MKHDPYGTGVLSKDIPEERERLELLQQALDPVSTKALAALPLGESPRCLDLASGAGSVSYWLADRFPGGTVTSADIDARYLDEDHAPNLRVHHFDMRVDDFPAESFDVIHARSVLKHIPERDEVLARMYKWLAPGGWLVIVDGYWFPSDETAHPEWSKPMDAIVRQMNSQGGDMRWTRKLPSTIARLGLTDVTVDLAPSLGGWDGWGAQGHRWIRPTIRQTGPTLVEKGYLSQEEVDRYLELPDGPDFAEWFGVIAAVSGRRP
ncbi:class I SAM-dependent methyltransferase [Streptomyces sp. TRM76323]|uniref:Class I SAM-dependent methyltransferase n=1 Tax=Streptomyces tamarix TaxID=3078565 RepID=A0ABU3QSS3_9ACTN|nr:class I SAM-dependent methyltransferase [Streptomyces tamarix]MDT9685831.1 class I SAM-dependent methyltransferase [Streptomyces tamarix]